MRIFIAVALLAAAGPAHAASKLGVQAGWWNVEADYEHHSGAFADLGFSWGIWALTGYSGMEWQLPVTARAGYGFALAETLQLRAGPQVLVNVDRGDPCGGCGSETRVASWYFADVGLRWRPGTSLALGFDVPVAGFKRSNGGSLRHEPASFLFGQAYVGGSWDL